MKVLFVQEQSFLATALRLALITKGYELVLSDESISPANAIAINDPNIVIADISRGNGYNYVEEAKKKKVPVLVISNNSADDDLQKAFDKGADDYMTMPMSFTELALRVNILTQKYPSLPCASLSN